MHAIIEEIPPASAAIAKEKQKLNVGFRVAIGMLFLSIMGLMFHFEMKYSIEINLLIFLISGVYIFLKHDAYDKLKNISAENCESVAYWMEECAVIQTYVANVNKDNRELCCFEFAALERYWHAYVDRQKKAKVYGGS